MASCDHLAWVHFSSEGDNFIHDDGRLQRILPDLVDPKQQWPSLLFFVGTKTKNVALRELFPYNNIRKARLEGLANLRLDTASVNSDYPLLFADSDASFRPPSQVQESPCHERTVYPLRWQTPSETPYADIIHARLFFLFADVICLFADDFALLEHVVGRLKSWARAGGNGGTPVAAHPKVVIVMRGDEASSTFNVLEAQDLRFKLHQQDLVGFFSSITVLYLADEQVSPLARYRRLKEVLLRHADEQRQWRQNTHSLYSALHLNRFMQEAVKHISQTVEAPFNFLHISRLHNPIRRDYCDHIARFLRLSSQHSVPDAEVTSFVASSMLMDAYPPGMHSQERSPPTSGRNANDSSDFDPRSLYDSIYRPYIVQAFRDHYGSPLADALNQKLQVHFMALTFVSTQHTESIARIHRENVRRRILQWSRLRSNLTCLSCLRRKPEHTLSCGHSLCDTCVQIFGEISPTKEYQYHVQQCLMCGVGSLTVSLKPPTAGIRILTIDGGGARGVVPLAFLEIFQATVGPACRIQDMFDLAFGTSSGGLIVLSLFMRHWTVSYCSQIFQKLIRQVFQRPTRGSDSIFQYVRRLIRCWLRDGYYNVRALEAFLKEYFGFERRMFDYSEGTSDTKIAVTATTISDASAYLFSSYNGSGARSKDCGYKHLRPEAVEDEPHVWEAGRVTSAAPVLFTPAHISAIGTFQDGGLKHNNPINLALWESQHIWPSIPRPDVVLSLGTGTDRESSSPKAPTFRHVFQDGFIPRLYRSFMSSLDGQSTWRDLQNRLSPEARKDYFRLNVPLTDKQWSIDDVERINELRDQVYRQSREDPACLEVATALMISAFFFELVGNPTFRSGNYHCQGVIRCRLQTAIVDHVLEQVQRSLWAFVTDEETLAYYEPLRDSCPTCQRYQKRVHFLVRHPTNTISIYMQGALTSNRRISGFPQSVAWFGAQQELTADFGTTHHGSSSRQACEMCNSVGLVQSSKRKSNGESCKQPKRKKPSRAASSDTLAEDP